MKKLVLEEIKIYANDLNDKYRQSARRHARNLGLSSQFIGIYSSRDPHPLSECSEIYLDDKEFMSKAIRIDPNSIKFASKKLRQNKSIAKIILKKDKKLAKKFIFKKVLSEIKYRKN